MMRSITKEQIFVLHQESLRLFGGLPGVKDEGVISSVIDTTFGGIGDSDFYPTVSEKAAKLLYSFTTNHSFVDGNKRIGWLSCNVFLDLNGYILTCDSNVAYDFVIDLADKKKSYEDCLGFIRKYIHSLYQN